MKEHAIPAVYLTTVLDCILYIPFMVADASPTHLYRAVASASGQLRNSEDLLLPCRKIQATVILLAKTAFCQTRIEAQCLSQLHYIHHREGSLSILTLSRRAQKFLYCRVVLCGYKASQAFLLSFHFDHYHVLRPDVFLPVFGSGFYT